MDERIIKYFSGELTADERLQLLREREENKGLKEEFSSFQNTLATLSFAPQAIDKEIGSNEYKVLTKIRRKQGLILYMKKTIGYAAAICIAILATWMIATTNESPAELAAVQQELFVPAGQRARITLPDGTIAWVNAGSSLQYPSAFGPERNVRLSGEAFFEVAHNPDQPFIVSTDHMNIKALGTQFNVYSYPKAEETHATLVEGSVKVYLPQKEEEGIILSPYQQAFCKDGDFRLENSVDRDELLWKEGIYSFKKQRLEEIIKKLELYYDVEIIVKDPSILNYEYTGKFRQRDGVLEILRIIQKIHGFKIQKDEELNQITLSK